MKAFFLSIPHSGEKVPPEATWLQNLPEPILMCDVDRYVDRLYQPVVDELKLSRVKSDWHRYAIDLNRLPEDIDEDSVAGNKNPSGKLRSMGLHWVHTTRGVRVLPKPISPSLHDFLVQTYFQPFHDEIAEIYKFFRERNATKIYHLDMHSMPSKGTKAHLDPGETRAEIVISDLEGKSCELPFKDLVMEAYSEAGFQVKYNWPYVGGRVTSTYGQPSRGQHVVQVEISRALYMDEETKLLIPERATPLKERLTRAVRFIFDHLPDI